MIIFRHWYWHWLYRDALDKLCMKIAWRLPKRLVMWASVRVIAHATAGEYSNQVVPDLLAMDALKRWPVQ